MRDMGDARRVHEESRLHEGRWAPAVTREPAQSPKRALGRPTAGCTSERGVRIVRRVPSELQSVPVRAGLAGLAAARGCRAPACGTIVQGHHVEMRGMGQGGALRAQPTLHVRHATGACARRCA